MGRQSHRPGIDLFNHNAFEGFHVDKLVNRANEDVVDRGMKEFRSSIVAADQQPRPPSGTNDPERLQPYTETSQGAAKPTKGALVAAGLK